MSRDGELKDTISAVRGRRVKGTRAYRLCNRTSKLAQRDRQWLSEEMDEKRRAAGPVSRRALGSPADIAPRERRREVA